MFEDIKLTYKSVFESNAIYKNTLLIIPAMHKTLLKCRLEGSRPDYQHTTNQLAYDNFSQ